MAVILLLAAAAPAAAQQEYRVDLDGERVVRFISRASIEEFEGVTDRIDGFLAIPGDAVGETSAGDGSEFFFEVDLASLDTGIGLRNRHMRDNYLEVKEHPYAAFGGSVSRVAPLDDGAFRVTVAGTLGIHGVERDRSIVCDTTSAGERLRVQCAFEVLLTDHDIDIPKVMFLKLSNEIRLELDFFLEPVGS